MNLKARLLPLLLLLAAISIGTPISAFAQVAIEGKLSYRISRFGSNLRSEGAVDRVSNYNYEPITGARIVYVLSKSVYKPGKNVKGGMIAQASFGTFAPRTYFTDITLSGASSAPKDGTYYVIALVIDGGNRILTAHTFSKRVNMGGRVPARRVGLGRATAAFQSADNDAPSYYLNQ